MSSGGNPYIPNYNGLITQRRFTGAAWGRDKGVNIWKNTLLKSTFKLMEMAVAKQNNDEN